MNQISIAYLKNPCNNRGLYLVDNGDETVTINDQTFSRLEEADKYLSGIPRIDLKPVPPSQEL